MSTTPIIQHPERIADKWFPLTNTIEVDVIRTATLNGDLSEIVTRRLVRIDVTLGQGDRRQTLHFSRDEALWLTRALADAIQSADDRKPKPTTPTPAADESGAGA